ncbi:MAG: DUF4250 domain-containing protein [Christensenellaceae bacterium]|nr:DUF4250 domain-containing protein [Christensenellaceae bacterium]
MIKDPHILLSYINTQLRDKYSSLDELSDNIDYDIVDVVETLASIGYYYDSNLNKFV